MDRRSGPEFEVAAQPVRCEKHGDIGFLVIDNPPVNASSVEVRRELLEGILALGNDATLRGIVIIGDGSTFIAGSDIREFDAPIQAPSLPEVILAIENAAVPVIAAIHGHALGGGFELALGCDGRIAVSGATMGLPEVSLGMIPGAGGTQRVAYITGKAKAIELVASSRRLTAAEALQLGLIDQLVDDDLADAAAQFALTFAARKRRIRDREVPFASAGEIESAIGAAMRLRKNLPHIQQAVDAVNMAGDVPFDEALSRERAVFDVLRTSVAARAFRHLFFAERECQRSRYGGRPDTAGIRRIGVVGAGTMGVGIAGCFADAGYEVVLFDTHDIALAAVAEKLQRTYDSLLKKGKLDEREMRERLARVRTVSDLGQLNKVDLAIEAVFEDFDVKRDIMAKLHDVLPPDAILASNTSYLDLNRLAADAGRPRRTVGLHFFSPAQAMRLLEIVETEHTDAATVDIAIAIAKRLGKVPVVARVAEGFIGNRIFAAYRKQCEYMLEEGALPEQIDEALEEFGFAMGPFAVADLSGLDIAWKMRQRLNAVSRPARYVTIPDALCEAGRFGRKTGAGYYLYEAGGRRGVPDPEVHTIIAREQRKRGIVPRSLGNDEIVERAMAAIVNEAAKVMEEGVASRTSDIDVALVHGYGFPRYLGGPVFWARQRGTDEMHDMIKRVQAASGPDFVVGDIDAMLAK
ncbi:3-hydroxyacyl-CoA dehydrogenase [Paraburkholderia sp. Ac-20342]|uniref:3-hydroxyacyl-CoA dehydrogenase NAD-binding domain-containing protein n=1 Tax=Paraburkholderia sp. Ac-20342 TaxID=2703889 RepID=UPI00142141F3|nr:MULTISPECIES: 3-hydroxyacyl-CoA dehydrogenase NAD-binding domain-containing protein [Burkholderiaceae]MBN3846582.1 3-hydroxyacyl-CoA dehydrogenase [Paraburkholderia sp. Ac-20342]NIF55668.1 3-hydroxyacyl-CoA dehydrogenase [Burkholderia sp. Ax-1724]NIF77991.1 3-hydroxyacyl-CoA dehydrogenase [Paraburkholderia sp. Cy-641]